MVKSPLPTYTASHYLSWKTFVHVNEETCIRILIVQKIGNTFNSQILT